MRNTLEPLDFAKLGKLDFEAPRTDDFPALNLARWAGEVGGTLPAIMNAANEVAVQAFIDGRISFPEIWETVDCVMKRDTVDPHPSLEKILLTDQSARRAAERRVESPKADECPGI